MIYILLAILFYSTAIIAGAFAARIANISLVTAVENIISGIIPLLLAVPLFSKRIIINQKLGILMAIVVGIFIALFTLSINKAYNQNKVAIVAPLVYGGTIFLSSILSTIFLKEKISFIQLIGLSLLGAGFVFIIYARITGK